MLQAFLVTNEIQEKAYLWLDVQQQNLFNTQLWLNQHRLALIKINNIALENWIHCECDSVTKFNLVNNMWYEKDLIFFLTLSGNF